MTTPSQEPVRSLPTECKWKFWWSDAQALIDWASVERCHTAAHNLIKVWGLNWPTFNKISRFYGENVARAIISNHMNAVLGDKRDMLSEVQLILSYLDVYELMRPYTVAEVLTFFSWLRTGKFKTYGYTTMEICRVFRDDFLPIRSNWIDRITTMRKERERILWEKRKATKAQIQELIASGKIKNPYTIKLLMDI